MEPVPEFNVDFFTRRLKERRTKLGLSARELSLRLKQHPNYIHKIEHGAVKRLSIEAFIHIANKLKVSLSYFFNEETPPEESKHYLELWRCLDKYSKEILIALMQGLLK